MPAKIKFKKEPVRIILDSNSFFVPLQFNIDIFEEIEKLLNRKCELILLPPIRLELEKLLEKGSPKMRRNASLALRLAEKCKLVRDLDDKYSGLTADEVVFQVSSDWNCAVFTNDKKLRARLRDINVPVIYVRGKSRLEIDGRI